MKKYKILCILMILFLTITNSSYALEETSDFQKMEENIIIDNKNPNLKIINQFIEKTKQNDAIKTDKEIKITKASIEEIKYNTNNDIINKNNIDISETVTDNVYKENAIPTKNTVKVSSGLPDLSMNSLTATVQPFQVGQDANFQYKIANYGDTNSYSTLIRVFIDDTLVGTLNIGTINYGYEYTSGFSLNGVPEGSYEIKLIAVPTGGDSNLSNNTISKNFTWKGTPDLVAKSFNTVSGKTSFVSGQSVDFIFTVTNEGTGMANGVINNHIIVNGEELAVIPYSDLDVGYTLTGRFTVTFNYNGDYTLQIHVNKNQNIIESRYNNNIATKSISIISSYAYLNYGWPTSTIPIQPYSYNSTWQLPMDASISNWNNAGAQITFNKSSSSNNSVIFDNLGDDFYGVNNGTCSGSELISFQIILNSETISNDATNFSNFVQSVFVHELGHSIWLADNPPTSSPSIMSYSRDRNVMTTPQTYDINAVKARY